MSGFFATDKASKVLFFQRLVLAAVILPHGLQKLVGAFGGYGFSATVGWFGSVGIPAPVATLVILGESLGAVALLFGLFSRFTAFGITAIMIGAALTHVPNGFFMDWYGAMAGEGFEFHLLALALSIPLMVKGGGAYAFDSLLAKVVPQRRVPAAA